MTIDEVLIRLGFKMFHHNLAPSECAYKYRFEEGEVTALPCTDMQLRSILHLSGVLVTPRTIQEVSYDLPLEVESFEQGVAFLAYALEGFKAVEWLVQGREWAHELPWKKRLAEYEKRSYCIVERDWLKQVFSKLRILAGEAEADSRCVFSFDGEVLKILTPRGLMVAPAKGQAWKESYVLSTKQLDFLPKRIIYDPVEVSVFDGRISIARRLFELV